MSPIIEVWDLIRRYGPVTAVDGVSFEVQPGSLFAFLGPNGAGKSTTISMLTTLARPDEGTVTYNLPTGQARIGHDDRAIRSRIGVVFQDSLLDKALSVRDNLSIRAKLTGPETDTAWVIEQLELRDVLKQKYGTLSGGQRRRVDIARALLPRPDILFLDEPTTGLDPQSRNMVWSILSNLRSEMDLTVFLTTHYMEEAEGADQVTIIDHGHIIAAGTPAHLRTAHSQSHLRLRGDSELENVLTGQGLATTTETDWVLVDVDSDQHALTILAANQSHITGFEFQHGTMDDVFLALTGSSLREH
ncbi:MAG: ABC transporter ATP-binding protein [Propionibacteriaceae bacterium]|jgi:multidrug/hemolysin transport system ATP-binding protein|nr:ABC transporter ATP-binding protein [Propionibacteriaceae bacterium]